MDDPKDIKYYKLRMLLYKNKLREYGDHSEDCRAHSGECSCGWDEFEGTDWYHKED